jgi:hypothetical protein
MGLRRGGSSLTSSQAPRARRPRLYARSRRSPQPGNPLSLPCPSIMAGGGILPSSIPRMPASFRTPIKAALTRGDQGGAEAVSPCAGILVLPQIVASTSGAADPGVHPRRCRHCSNVCRSVSARATSPNISHYVSAIMPRAAAPPTASQKAASCSNSRSPLTA